MSHFGISWASEEAEDSAVRSKRLLLLVFQQSELSAEERPERLGAAQQHRRKVASLNKQILQKTRLLEEVSIVCSKEENIDRSGWSQSFCHPEGICELSSAPAICHAEHWFLCLHCPWIVRAGCVPGGSELSLNFGKDHDLANLTVEGPLILCSLFSVHHNLSAVFIWGKMYWQL